MGHRSGVENDPEMIPGEHLLLHVSAPSVPGAVVQRASEADGCEARNPVA
jgi:hypothetical protein